MIIEFWLLAAALTLALLALLVYPLLRKQAPQQDDLVAIHAQLYARRIEEMNSERDNGNLDDSQYASAKEELERELLHDTSVLHETGAKSGRGWTTALVLIIALPLLAVGLYREMGSPAHVDPLPPVAQNEATDKQDLPPVEEMLASLEARMQEQPDNLAGWQLLGRTYVAMQRYQDAETALAKAYALQPEDASVMASYAEAMALAGGSRLAGRPTELIEAALQLDPQHPDALWLSSMAAAQAGDFGKASKRLQQLLHMLDPSSPDAQMVQQQLAQLQAQVGDSADTGDLEPIVPATTPGMTAEESKTAEASVIVGQGPAITVAVSLDPGLQSSVSPQDTLFIYAQAVSGPRMPLAIARQTVSALPVTVKLDDSSAMMPAMKLSNFEEVMVMARVSKSGNAMTQSGDLIGRFGPVAVKDAPSVQVTISEQAP